MVKSDLLVKIGSGHVYQSKEVLGELKPMKQAQPLTNIYVSLPTDVCTGYRGQPGTSKSKLPCGLLSLFRNKMSKEEAMYNVSGLEWRDGRRPCEFYLYNSLSNVIWCAFGNPETLVYS